MSEATTDKKEKSASNLLKEMRQIHDNLSLTQELLGGNKAEAEWTEKVSVILKYQYYVIETLVKDVFKIYDEHFKLQDNILKQWNIQEKNKENMIKEIKRLGREIDELKEKIYGAYPLQGREIE